VRTSATDNDYINKDAFNEDRVRVGGPTRHSIRNNDRIIADDDINIIEKKQYPRDVAYSILPVNRFDADIAEDVDSITQISPIKSNKYTSKVSRGSRGKEEKKEKDDDDYGIIIKNNSAIIDTERIFNDTDYKNKVLFLLTGTNKLQAGKDMTIVDNICFIADSEKFNNDEQYRNNLLREHKIVKFDGFRIC